jgi:hypothetical protein
MARSAPSYGPSARARAIADRWVAHRTHEAFDEGSCTHGSGSPHRVQSGGVNSRTPDQQPSQIDAPARSTMRPHAAHAGASSAPTQASIACRR